MKSNLEKNVGKVLQSPFDKAFVQVVEFLYDNWHLHKKFRKKAELWDQLKWNGNDYAKIKAGNLNLPKKYVPEISKVLVRDYGVSPMFLNTATGPMFSDSAKQWLVEEPAQFYGFTEENFELLKRELEVVKARLGACQKENEQLKETMLTRTDGRTKYKKS
jgi:hypothetical protein